MLFYMCLCYGPYTFFYKTAVYLTFKFAVFLLNLAISFFGKRCRPFLLHSRKIVQLAVRTVCRYYCLLNYAVVQLRQKERALTLE